MDTDAATQRRAEINFRMVGKLAVLEIDNPPVNAGSRAVRAGLLAGLERATLAKAEGAVLIGGGAQLYLWIGFARI